MLSQGIVDDYKVERRFTVHVAWLEKRFAGMAWR